MKQHDFEWSVIGAGPAGILTVGMLIDNGIDPKNILWLDPSFTVGDFGSKWSQVPSNTKVDLFLKFLHHCQAFKFSNCPHSFQLSSLDPSQTCNLSVMAEPLLWVTAELQKQVHCVKTTVTHVNLQERLWYLRDATKQFSTKNVVLAIGSDPKTLNFSNMNLISLMTALNPEQLTKTCNGNDTIAVLGSSHSAILVLRNLIEHTSVKSIVNFYRAPLKFAIPMDDWILHDNTGLKGSTAHWAKENINGALPARITRHLSNQENIEHYLPQCNKIIYSTGFEKRQLPVIDNIGHLEYCDATGIIAPGLFGIGIAFPEGHYNPLGMFEHRVGLWKFMDYITRLMPIWLRYST